MERWRKILRRFGPRSDRDRPFYGDRLDVEGPVLINTMGPMSAAFVGARVLRAIAARGGTLLRPAAIEKLENLIARGLPQAVIHHCEAEAEQILEWLERAPPSEESELQGVSQSPELDMMMAADLESRLSVATFALEEGYGIELEYFDEDTESWPRIRAELVEIDDAEAADFHTSLVVQNRHGEMVVPLKYVRWLMPIPPLPREELEHDHGEVVDFPGPLNET